MQLKPPREDIDGIYETDPGAMTLYTLLSEDNFVPIKRLSLQLELGQSSLQDVQQRSSVDSLALQFTGTLLSLERISGHTYQKELLVNHNLLPDINLEQWQNHHIWLTFPCQLKSF